MHRTLRRQRAAIRLGALAVAAVAACATPEIPAAPDAAPSLARAPRATVPDAPTSVVATAGDARATVSWRAPKKDGNSPILAYRVRSAPGGVTVTVAAPTTTAAVTGLTNGTAYTFTVVATNAVGDSPASPPSAAVTPVAPTPPPPPPPAGARWVSGYYVGYQRSLYPETAVDFSSMTHVFVGRIRPATDGSVIANFDIDDVNGPAMARTLASRAHQAGRRAVLMLGGEGEHAGFVGAASDANRARFVTNLLARMDELGYDGIDVDWEPIYGADRAPLLALLKDLRARRPAMLITIPVGWANTNFPSEIDAWYGQVAAVVDQMNVMTYSMAGPYGGWVSWHSSALLDHAPNHPSSVASSAQLYLTAGVPAAKLGVGIGAFGSCWNGVTGPRQTIGSGVTMIAGDNAMSYANILAQYYASAARVWDDAAKVPYLTFATPTGPQQCTFVSYEDEQSVTAKGAYVKSAGLGGAILWTVGQQHVGSAPAGSQDPLLRAAYSSIVP